MYFVAHQVIGRRGGDNPGQKRSAKTGHNALTACGSAAGVMLPPFLTFKGKKKLQRLTEGVPEARYHLTGNGWPDGSGWYKFVQHVVEWKNKNKLDKLLLVVDGHDDHFFLPALLLLRANNIRLLVLCGACTHKMQPLDVGVFAALKALVTRYINEEFGVVANKDWARHVARAYKHWETTSNAKGEHPMTAAFRHAGLFPSNFGVFTDVDFAKSDAMLGLSADHEDVKKAKAFKLEELSLVLDSTAAASKPAVKVRLAKHVAKMGFDLNMVAPTDDNVVIKLLDKSNFNEKKAADKAQRKIDREEKASNKIVEAERKKEIKIAKVAANAVAAAAAEAEKANRAAAKAAKAVAHLGGKKRRSSSAAVEEEGGEGEEDPYARVYVSRVGVKKSKL
jgi:hypothetical protein